MQLFRAAAHLKVPKPKLLSSCRWERGHSELKGRARVARHLRFVGGEGHARSSGGHWPPRTEWGARGALPLPPQPPRAADHYEERCAGAAQALLVQRCNRQEYRHLAHFHGHSTLSAEHIHKLETWLCLGMLSPFRTAPPFHWLLPGLS